MNVFNEFTIFYKDLSPERAILHGKENEAV